jgi:hypothetical protein
VPVHNGTFDLSTHAWFDPFVQIKELAQQHNVQLMTPLIGEVVIKQSSYSNYAWWEDFLVNELRIPMKEFTK